MKSVVGEISIFDAMSSQKKKAHEIEKSGGLFPQRHKFLRNIKILPSNIGFPILNHQQAKGLFAGSGDTQTI